MKQLSELTHAELLGHFTIASRLSHYTTRELYNEVYRRMDTCKALDNPRLNYLLGQWKTAELMLSYYVDTKDEISRDELQGKIADMELEMSSLYSEWRSFAKN